MTATRQITGSDYAAAITVALAAKQSISSVLVAPAKVSNRYYLLDSRAGVSSASNIGTLRLRTFLFRIWEPITIKELGANIVTSSASGNFKLAIYAHDNTNIRPTGAPLAATGNIVTDSATEVSAALVGANVTLAPGLYWGALKVDNATVAFSGWSGQAAGQSMVGHATLSNMFGSSSAQMWINDYTTGVTYAADFPDLTSVTPDSFSASNNNAALIGRAV